MKENFKENKVDFNILQKDNLEIFEKEYAEITHMSIEDINNKYKE